MNAYIEKPRKIFSGSKSISLIFPFLILLISFKPAEDNRLQKLPVVKKQLNIERPFRSIRIEGDVSLVLTNAPAGTIVIEGKEKYLKNINPEFEHNTLIIDANRMRLFAKLTIYLSALTLQAIQLNGDGNISSIDLIQSAYLHLSLNGNIKVNVKTMGQINFDTPDDVELSKPLVYAIKK